MNLGEFRRKTKDLPDNTELVVWDNDVGVSWFSVDEDQVIPTTPIHPNPVYVLEIGEQVELQFDLAVRTGIDER